MKKKFDAVAMKRKAQEEIYEEIKDLSPDEQVEYFNKAGERFWRETDASPEKKKTPRRTKTRKETTTS